MQFLKMYLKRDKVGKLILAVTILDKCGFIVHLSKIVTANKCVLMC